MSLAKLIKIDWTAFSEKIAFLVGNFESDLHSPSTFDISLSTLQR